ncbi:tyrosine-type recombinase/integrase [Liquorilactobacillus satsumensis]|nr:tyrosine-type recombinase/integrase [Liquorilactobacillus satsumensis]MCP9371925.1 tyrosine-type recombinase/integrase [Liquorilactobacillus satsumensis]
MCIAKESDAQSNKPSVWATRITKRYDLKHTPVHGFRHTYATLAIQGGMQPKELQIQLGHSDI